MLGFALGVSQGFFRFLIKGVEFWGVILLVFWFSFFMKERKKGGVSARMMLSHPEIHNFLSGSHKAFA